MTTSTDSDDARASFSQEALDSWAEFQATGRHLTLDELCAWLDTWGTFETRPAPEPHE